MLRRIAISGTLLIVCASFSAAQLITQFEMPHGFVEPFLTGVTAKGMFGTGAQ